MRTPEERRREGNFPYAHMFEGDFNYDVKWHGKPDLKKEQEKEIKKERDREYGRKKRSHDFKRKNG